MKNKKAASHVEIIVAFVLFIGVILTFFFLIKPFSYTEEKPVENIKQAVLNSMTEEIGILSAIVEDPNNDCYNLNDVIDDYGNYFIEVQNDPKKYTLYFHQMFGRGRISCELQPNRNHNLGIYKKQNFLTKPRITTLKQSYETNYLKLKQTLGIRNDFSIEFKDFNNQQITELTPTNLKKPPTGVNVIAKEFPVQVIDKNANINNYVLNLRIW